MAKTNSSRLHKFTVHYYTKDEYHYLKREIFTYDTYYFETDNPAPVIIDAGAHLGMATLYFKHLYPNAQITAIEPNPYTFELLEMNVFENVLRDVTTIQAALAAQQGEAQFYLDKTANQWWSTAGFIEGAWTGDQESLAITVPTITLAELVQAPVDLLKMDIEGAESEVLMASESVLPMIKQIFVEFHPHENQDKFKLVEMLEQYYDLKILKDGKEVPLKKARGLIQIEGKLISG